MIGTGSQTPLAKRVAKLTEKNMRDGWTFDGRTLWELLKDNADEEVRDDGDDGGGGRDRGA